MCLRPTPKVISDQFCICLFYLNVSDNLLKWFECSDLNSFKCISDCVLKWIEYNWMCMRFTCVSDHLLKWIVWLMGFVSVLNVSLINSWSGLSDKICIRFKCVLDHLLSYLSDQICKCISDHLLQLFQKSEFCRVFKSVSDHLLKLLEWSDLCPF